MNKNINDIVKVFIEISKGSNVKYEFDKKSSLLVVDRFLHTSMHYPFNYGFIPDTHGEDGDPVDILVLSQEPVLPGTILPSRIVGVLETEDEKGNDLKLIAVPLKSVDPDYQGINDIGDIYDSTKDKIKHFFEYYKSLEKGKWVKVKKWHGKETAVEYLKKGLKQS